MPKPTRRGRLKNCAIADRLSPHGVFQACSRAPLLFLGIEPHPPQRVAERSLLVRWFQILQTRKWRPHGLCSRQSQNRELRALSAIAQPRWGCLFLPHESASERTRRLPIARRCPKLASSPSKCLQSAEEPHPLRHVRTYHLRI